jgi:hypothetical protein
VSNGVASVYGVGSVVIAGGYPSPSDVKLGVTYGPTGTEYTGTFSGGGNAVLMRRR